MVIDVLRIEAGTGILYGDADGHGLGAYQPIGTVAARAISLVDVDGDGFLDVSYAPLDKSPWAYYRGQASRDFVPSAGDPSRQ